MKSIAAADIGPLHGPGGGRSRDRRRFHRRTMASGCEQFHDPAGLFEQVCAPVR
jgi:hypothetical protein